MASDALDEVSILIVGLWVGMTLLKSFGGPSRSVNTLPSTLMDLAKAGRGPEEGVVGAGGFRVADDDEGSSATSILSLGSSSSSELSVSWEELRAKVEVTPGVTLAGEVRA